MPFIPIWLGHPLSWWRDGQAKFELRCDPICQVAMPLNFGLAAPSLLMTEVGPGQICLPSLWRGCQQTEVLPMVVDSLEWPLPRNFRQRQCLDFVQTQGLKEVGSKHNSLVTVQPKGTLPGLCVCNQKLNLVHSVVFVLQAGPVLQKLSLNSHWNKNLQFTSAFWALLKLLYAAFVVVIFLLFTVIFEDGKKLSDKYVKVFPIQVHPRNVYG